MKKKVCNEYKNPHKVYDTWDEAALAAAALRSRHPNFSFHTFPCEKENGCGKFHVGRKDKTPGSVKRRQWR